MKRAGLDPRELCSLIGNKLGLDACDKARILRSSKQACATAVRSVRPFDEGDFERAHLAASTEVLPCTQKRLVEVKLTRLNPVFFS
jgi:hypothetical protein